MLARIKDVKAGFETTVIQLSLWQYLHESPPASGGQVDSERIGAEVVTAFISYARPSVFCRDQGPDPTGPSLVLGLNYLKSGRYNSWGTCQPEVRDLSSRILITSADIYSVDLGMEISSDLWTEGLLRHPELAVSGVQKHRSLGNPTQCWGLKRVSGIAWRCQLL
jgi:hypothetical protein